MRIIIGLMQEPNATAAQISGVVQPTQNIVIISDEPVGFTWKHFAIGTLVPIMLLVTPILLLNGMEQPDWGAPTETNELKLAKSEGTNYSANFELEDHLVIDHCRVVIEDQEQTDFNYWCDNFKSHFVLFKEERDTAKNTKVGEYSKESGVITFDNSIDYGESLDFKLTTYDEALEPEAPAFMLVVNLIRGICLVYPLISIAFIGVGLSSGRKGLGYGGIASLLAYPILAIVSLTTLWKHI